MTPGCSVFQPLVGVEDLTFPQGKHRNALKTAQPRRTCPDLRAKRVMVKIKIRAEHVVNHVDSFPQRGAHCNGCLTKFVKCSFQITPVHPYQKVKMNLLLSHTWLTSHLLRPASTLFTCAMPKFKSKYFDQYYVTCVASINARLFRLSATCGCLGPNVFSRMAKARL